ncbi:MAG: F0F1 ATP synthase subunit A [Bdellovibrionota bacterium]
MNLKRSAFTIPGLMLVSGSAYASGGIPHFINYYEMITTKFGLDHHFMVVLSALLVIILLFLIGSIFSKSVNSKLEGGDLTPDGKFSLSLMVEVVMDFVYSLTKDQCGKEYKKYFGLLSSIFLFILVCNLTGLIPGFPPATESMSTNVAIGLVAFVVYNVSGFKEHGLGYIKQFMGPVIFIAPLFFCIELFSHFSRPLSLGLRLTGNIFGDHLLLGVFTGLFPFVIPSVLMFFGLLVACVQSFVFTLLTGIYISMAISHDH